ncbi:MAG TPA: AzlD domain-containing protein [Thermoleophilaceae bacterium]
MNAAWTTIAGLAVATFAIKASGPVALGGRSLPDWGLRLIALVAPALLGALVVVETFGRGKELVIDARVAGMVAAAAVLAARRSVLWAVAAAAVVTALVRALG